MKKSNLYRFCFVFAVLLVASLFVPRGLKAAGQESKARKTINFVTNAVGSGYYTAAVAQAQAIARNSNIDVVVQPTQGANIVPNVVNSGEAELGIAAADLIRTDINKNLRLVEVGHYILFACIVGADSGIKTMADLKGKKLQRIRPGTGNTDTLSAAMLEAFGIDPDKDVVSLRAENSTKAIDDVADGRAAGTFSGISGAKMEEFDKNVKGGSYVVPFPADKFEYVKKKFPYMKLITVKAGSQPGVKKDTPVIGWPTVLITNKSVANDTVYTIVKTLIDQQKELVKINPMFKEWALDVAAQSEAAPFHPGAIKYYTEKGVWKEAAKAKVKEQKPKKK